MVTVGDRESSRDVIEGTSVQMGQRRSNVEVPFDAVLCEKSKETGSLWVDQGAASDVGGSSCFSAGATAQSTPGWRKQRYPPTSDAASSRGHNLTISRGFLPIG